MVVHLILDVNGVLVKRKWTTSAKAISEDDNVLPLVNKKGFQHVMIRPFAVELLRAISSAPGVQLVFWSSMTPEYMDPIIDLLTGLAGVTDYATLSQNECTVGDHPTSSYKKLFSKDVARIYDRFQNSEGTIFVDDSMLKMGYNEGEVICIVSEWDGVDKSDVVLSELIGRLPSLMEEAK